MNSLGKFSESALRYYMVVRSPNLEVFTSCWPSASIIGYVYYYFLLFLILVFGAGCLLFSKVKKFRELYFEIYVYGHTKADIHPLGRHTYNQPQ